MRLSNDWNCYKIIDAGNGEKLESWNGIILRRPDPQAIWTVEDSPLWKQLDAFYHRSNKGGGNWEFRRKLPNYWTVSYKELTFKVSQIGRAHV